MLNERVPRILCKDRWDLVIVGGGSYGILIALEAARRRLRPILIERTDFAAATSSNSLRIIHGGLRYLQTLDLRRYFMSYAERSWFLRHFPDLVKPLPHLMPLYGGGFRQPATFRAGLAVNRLLSRWSKHSDEQSGRFPPDRVLDVAEVREMIPGVQMKGLRGGALWHDAFVANSPRLWVECLHWACSRGALALNYVAARGLLLESGRVAGVRAVDTLNGEELSFRAPVVMNAAGPWAPSFAACCGSPAPHLMRPCLAWNVVLERSPLTDCALAVAPRRPGAQTYFVMPWKGALLAGTGYAPWHGGPDNPCVSRDLLGRFIADLNAALPGLQVAERHVGRVMAGLLPARRTEPGVPCDRPVILDHGQSGGPTGLYSLSGVKLTTARNVAQEVLARAFPAAQPKPYREFARPAPRDEHPDYTYDWMPASGDDAWRKPLARACAEEAVVHLDDLLLRRSSLGDNPARANALAPKAAELFDWDDRRTRVEISILSDEPQLDGRGMGPTASENPTAALSASRAH